MFQKLQKYCCLSMSFSYFFLLNENDTKMSLNKWYLLQLFEIFELADGVLISYVQNAILLLYSLHHLLQCLMV